MHVLAQSNLKEIRLLLSSLSNEQYQYKSKLLSGSSIGEHIRHILEFYLCLIEGRHKGVVNYDKRERNPELESNVKFAAYTIDKICDNMNTYSTCCDLVVEGNFSDVEKSNAVLKSSWYRELIYNLEHSIHHQALVKIGLIEQGLENLIPHNFGIAPATIRYKEKCAQ